MFTLKKISKALSMPYSGDGSLSISSPAEPKDALETHLALAMESQFFDDLKNSKAKVALLINGTDWRALGLEGALFVDRSKYALSIVNDFFEKPIDFYLGIHSTALISDSAIIEKGVSIGPFSIIGDFVHIKENSKISSHVSIGNSVIIGRDALIHVGVRIGPNVKIGDRFICHSNAVLGSDGFSFVAPDSRGADDARKNRNPEEISKVNNYVRVASLGAVTICDDVEIGAGTTVDRGTVRNTKIGSGTKLDNMVHLGHNVSIGENCLLCAQVGIAGSSQIGDRVVLGGQVGIADHISIGENTIVAGKSGVSSNVAKGQFMMGNPAMKIENNIASYKSLRRLPRILKRIEQLQKSLLK